MLRTLLTLVIFAAVPQSLASAEFLIDDFSEDIAGTAVFTSVDDFGTSYNITRTSSGVVQNGPETEDITVAVPSTGAATISYAFTDDISFPGLGYYAQNFALRFDGLSPSADFGINVSAVGETGLVANWQAAPVEESPNGPGPGAFFFDLTNFDNVGVLNDLQSLTFEFVSLDGAARNINLSGLSLVATPEPTSAVSFGLLGLIGLVGSSRRRKK